VYHHDRDRALDNVIADTAQPPSLQKACAIIRTEIGCRKQPVPAIDGASMTSVRGGGQPQAAAVTAERAPALVRERGAMPALFVLLGVDAKGGPMIGSVLIPLAEAEASGEASREER
jgi:hypothetical protein